jgi:peptidoglycan/xylan/chitin deacetylase (PgdA/CDA1 family)
VPSVSSKERTMLRTTLLSAAFEAIYQSRLAQLMAPLWGGIGVIFCLHHVVPGGGQQSGFAPNSNLEITPEFLSDIITLVKSKGYATLSMSEAVHRLKSGIAGPRFAVFTLDDGYKDNLIHALPVFQVHQCPFTVYVSTCMADGMCNIWWRVLEAAVAKAERLRVDFNGERITVNTADEPAKWAAWKMLAPRLQALPEYEQRDVVKRLADYHHVDINALCSNAAMTWAELRLMSANPLATIGAHTLDHFNLLKLPEADARKEIIDSGHRISSELGKSVEHFAYPYGNRDAAGPREFKLCAEAGYQSAVVTRLGTIQQGHIDNLQALPRIMISGRFQKTRYIESLISGVPARLSNGLRGLNVA